MKNLKFVDCLKGKLFADKGYVSQELLELLFLNDIQLVTGMKRNMKNTGMNLTDKILLRKRSVIETVNGYLKTICQVESGASLHVGRYYDTQRWQSCFPASRQKVQDVL